MALAVMLLVLTWITLVAGETLERPAVNVVRVIDGDTLDVMVDGMPQRWRLIGLNAPERYDLVPCARRWAQTATAVLTRLSRSGPLAYTQDVIPTDQYGRVLVYLYAADTFVNEAMLREGYGRLGPLGRNRQHRHRFIAAQAQAQSRKAGMWRDP